MRATAGSPSPNSSRLIKSVTKKALTKTAIAAFQHKFKSMNFKSHCHVVATIKTGGAANEVNVPPMDILTNSTPRVAYFRRSLTRAENTESRSMSAASVMAAGSVIKEPSNGTTDNNRK